jgi:glutathionylspermidine synthase
MSETVLAQILNTLNRIEGKVDDNHKEISTRLNKHMDEEEGEIEAIMQIVQDNREESDRRHTALIESINSYMTKQTEIEEAFLKGEDGKRDFHGHHLDHASRLTRAQWFEKIRDHALGKIIEWAALGFVVWLLMSMWQTFLKGPAP